MSAIDEFRNAIKLTGLAPPDAIKADSKLHRFSSNDKSGDDAGWYVLHDDGIPAGEFGCWRTGIREKWRADIGRVLSPAEEATHRFKLEAIHREREAEEARRRAEAKTKAGEIWNRAEPASADHAYLLKKHIKPHGARKHDGALVIPVRDAKGELHSLQFIAAAGGKRFLTGGRVVGCYFTIGNLKCAETLCIAEGYATGVTIFEATNYPVAVAFNAGNLQPVAQALRAKFPGATLIVCAEDDAATDRNPGLSKATRAALAVGAKLAVPDLGAERPNGASDFNDMAALLGIEAVARAIASASEVKAPLVDPIDVALSACGLAGLQSGASLAAVEKAV